MPARLPRRSASAPISSAPSGRVTKPTPKVETDSSSDSSGSCAGKNARPIITAKVP